MSDSIPAVRRGWSSRLAVVGALSALVMSGHARAQVEAGESLDPVPPPPAQETEAIPPPPESTRGPAYVPPQQVAAMHLARVDRALVEVERDMQLLRANDPSYRRGRRFFWTSIGLGVPTIVLGATSFIHGFAYGLSPDPPERWRRVYHATLGVALPLLVVTMALLIRGIRLQRNALRPLGRRRSALLRERKQIVRDFR